MTGWITALGLKPLACAPSSTQPIAAQWPSLRSWWGSDTIERLFTPDELRKLFDAVVLSYAEHVAKPSREAFELAADRLGVPPSQCVMIDDRLDNCSGAEAAGMRAILHTANSRTMAELEELLEEQ